MTSFRFASSPKSRSAGGHDEQPCEVNNSTTTGRVSAAWAAETRSSAVRNEIVFISGMIQRREPRTTSRFRDRRVLSGELLLHCQIVLDKELNGLVDAGIRLEAERLGSRRLERGRPAADDRL